MRLDIYDNPQQAFAFLQSQAAFIETEIYRVQYPEIIYAQLVPIDSICAREFVLHLQAKTAPDP